MVDSQFVSVPTANVSADMEAVYPDIAGEYVSVPAAHVTAVLSTNEPGP